MIGSNESLGQVILQLSDFDLEQGCQSNFALADLVSFRSLMVVLATRRCAHSKIELGFHYDACPLYCVFCYTIYYELCCMMLYTLYKVGK